MPCGGLGARKLEANEDFGHLGALAGFLFRGDETRNRRTVLQQDEGDVLIANEVHAFGEVAGGFGDADGRFFHKIRLSDIP